MLFALTVRSFLTENLFVYVQANPEDSGSITPLHLAAVQGSKDAAILLADNLPPDAWFETLTIDGYSPSDFCRKAGHFELDACMLARQGQDSVEQAPDATTAQIVLSIPRHIPEAVTCTPDQGLAETGAEYTLMSGDSDDSQLCHSSHCEECSSSFKVIQQGRSACCLGLGRSEACLGQPCVTLPTAVVSH